LDRIKLAGRILGPALFLALLVLPELGSLQGDAKRVAAVALWMAAWWVTEAVPLAATSLLPLVLFPLLGARGVLDVPPSYLHPMVFLFLGGFVLALCVEHSGLHRRLALAVLWRVGGGPRRLVWGFLLISAGLSMWLSNTATTLMLLPIGAAVAARVAEGRARTRLFLAVAYGASIGGIGTLIGTPPNIVLAGKAADLVEGLAPLTFGGWMLFGIPVVLCLLPLAGLLLGRGLAGGAGDLSAVEAQRAALGPTGPAERRAAALFGLTALAWITRSGFDFGEVSVPGWSALFDNPKTAHDAIPAVAAAVAALLIPAGSGGRRFLIAPREIVRGVPWGILLLFGGGFALADGVAASGLDDWLAAQLHGLKGAPTVLVVLAVCLLTTAATEFTSNTAMASLLLPVMAALSQSLGVPAYLLLVPATVSASCAFMLPVATPPNAIVIGSGHVSPRDLFREGLPMNLVGAAVITALTLTLGRWVLPG